MFIDLIFIVLIIGAIVRGYSQGLILAIFSVLALVIGLAAAIKLSAVTATWLKDSIHVATKWLPVIAFVVVFLIAVLLVRLGARAIEKTAELVLLGWVNKLGGVLLYTTLYILIFSVLLFYAEKMNIIKPEVITASRTYDFIKPWGPKVMATMGDLIPFFKNTFQELETFFANLSEKIAPH
jgi:membrane protein required for colicin V production